MTAGRLVVLGQVSLLFGVACCVALLPHYLLEANQGGVSNYGVHARTVLPYSLGFGLCGLFSWWAGRLLPAGGRFRTLLRTYAVGMLAVLGSSYVYKTNPALTALHVAVAALLVLVETGFAAWLFVVIKDGPAAALLGLELSGFLLGGVTLFGGLHILFLTQLIIGVGFGALLVRGGRRIASEAGNGAAGRCAGACPR